MSIDREATESSHLSDLGLMHNRVVTLVEMNQRLADERDRLRAGLERMRDWPKVGEHGQVLSISHGLLADYIEDILESK